MRKRTLEMPRDHPSWVMFVAAPMLLVLGPFAVVDGHAPLWQGAVAVLAGLGALWIVVQSFFPRQSSSANSAPDVPERPAE